MDSIDSSINLSQAAIPIFTDQEDEDEDFMDENQKSIFGPDVNLKQSSAITAARIKLPPTLLSNPLPEKK